MEEERIDELLYVISKICEINKGKVFGRKQLEKIMFFVEHYNLEIRKLTPQKFLGNNFVIYKYGPFSFEIMEMTRSLLKEGLIEEDGNYSITLGNGSIKRINKIMQKMPTEKMKRINQIVNIFGKYDGGKLEELSLKMIPIKKEDKPKLMGVPVSELIQR